MAEQVMRTTKVKEVRDRLPTQLKGLANVEKYFIISMKGSYMDVHIDMSATCVFYHVVVGKKVFFLVEPTERNLALYMEWERRKETGLWVVAQFEGGVSKVEINPGEVAILKAGTLHFVFTPEDSIVFGGNFLTTENVSLTFRATEVEQECVKIGLLGQSNLFANFYNSWLMYLELCVATGSRIGESEQEVKTLLHELEKIPHVPGQPLWYKNRKRLQEKAARTLYQSPQVQVEDKEEEQLPANDVPSTSGPSPAFQFDY